MTKTEICRKMAEGRTLVYYLIEEDEKPSPYGVSVLIEESGDETKAVRLSNERERVERLIDLLATYFITPASLESVVYKWLATI